MKTLVTAKPNMRYRWVNNYLKTSIRCVIDEQKKVHFVEVFGEKINFLTDDFVKTLFPLDCHISDRPFVIAENRVFWALLNRKRKNFAAIYDELIERLTAKKVFRTNVPKLKRTK